MENEHDHYSFHIHSLKLHVISLAIENLPPIFAYTQFALYYSLLILCHILYQVGFTQQFVVITRSLLHTSFW